MTVRKTLVVGLGEVGEPLARVLERSAPVMRQDLEPRDFSDSVGTMHICFPFVDSAKFIQTVVDYTKRFAPKLTIINSTVLPGTTRAIARIVKGPICYSPVRGKHTRMAEALLHYTKFVAGSDDDAAAAGIEHFQSAGLKTERIGSLETLELAKLAETTYFGVCIAFAQELNRYANATGADYDEAVRFFKEVEFLPNQTYFPGFIGGHCVIPNIDLLLKVAGSPLLEAVLDSNQRRALEIAESADSQLEASKGEEP